MGDGKDDDGKGTYVNRQISNNSIANPGIMFQKMINNQNESLKIVTYYVEMSLFDIFYDDYIDFKKYMRDILDARYTNVAAENELVSDEKKVILGL